MKIAVILFLCFHCAGAGASFASYVHLKRQPSLFAGLAFSLGAACEFVALIIGK